MFLSHMSSASQIAFTAVVLAVPQNLFVHIIQMTVSCQATLIFIQIFLI